MTAIDGDAGVGGGGEGGKGGRGGIRDACLDSQDCAFSRVGWDRRPSPTDRPSRQSDGRAGNAYVAIVGSLRFLVGSLTGQEQIHCDIRLTPLPEYHGHEY